MEDCKVHTFKTNKRSIRVVQKYVLVFCITLSYCFNIQQCFPQSDKIGDYTSKVPHFTFDSTLSGQELQLKNNPLIIRFAESRKKFENDKFRPIYHFVNPEGKLNDPNGLCYWKDNWHLFYQAYPPEDPRQHWGHAISKDLIHWKDLPYAIYPNPEYQCYSGSTLVEESRVIAMYHGTRSGNMVAVSKDPLLLNWTKLSGKAVIPINQNNDKPPAYTVFDPCIWSDEGTYYSLSAGNSTFEPTDKSLRANYLFKSKDLISWEYLHEFVKNDRFTILGDDGACPYFLPIGNQYILSFFSHMSGGQYLLGDYDRINDVFIARSHGKFNFGAATPAGVHAPSATNQEDGSVIIIFNMNPGKPTLGWNQIMTLPRKLTLKGTDTLGIEPAGDIESLRYNHKRIDTLKLPANKEIVLNSIQGNALEIIANIDPKNAPMIELNVLRSPNKEEYTRIAFFKDRGFHQGRPYELPRPANWKYNHESLITLETSYSSILPDVISRAPETAPIPYDSNQILNLRIFIDKSVVEVFANGTQCIAARVYPDRSDSIGVSIRSQGQDSELISLDSWQMKNIYND